MRELIKSPRKPRTLISLAIATAPWPEWVPRPAIATHAPEATLPPTLAKEEGINFESELSSVAEVRAQAVRAPAARRSRADDDEHEDSIAAQTKLIKIIGSRMREAREMSGLSQKQAADLLGYANSSKLAKIEGATDTRSVPLQTILKAAELYQVSVDFIFGIADDWERDPQLCRERAIGRWLYERLDRARTHDIAIFAELAHRIEIATAQITHLADGAEQARLAFDRFADINPTFPDLIGGARLQASLSALDDAGRKARGALRRLNLDLGLEQVGAMEPTHG